MDNLYLPQPQALAIPQPGMGINPTGAGAASLPDMLSMLREEFGISAPPEPVYRRGFKVPPKPNLDRIMSEAMVAEMNHQDLLRRMYHDVLWYRMLYVGMFPEDIEQKNLGFDMDEYRSPSMAQELEIVSGFLGGLPLRPRKRVMDERFKSEAAQLLDVIRYWREQAEADHEDQYQNGPLSLEEGKYLTLFGRIINRTVANVADPQRPLRECLIDPTTFFPIYAGYKGMVKAYHVYEAPLGQVLGDYDDIPKPEMDKLKNDYGNNFDENQMVKVTEYWDEWWRAVAIPSCTIMPVKDHRYGETPFTQGMGPNGEPGAMRMPYFGPAWSNSAESVAHQPTTNDMVFKGLSYIHFMRIEHEQYEAIMARMITALKQAVNPATILEESNEAVQSGKRPALDLTPGAVNKLILGEQKWNPVKTEPSPIAMDSLMNANMSERNVTRMPDAFMGANDKSNVSGTSMSNMSGAGLEKIGKWVLGKEQYHSRVYAKNLRLYRNIGFLAKYVDDTPSPVMVPSKRGSGFELTPELIDQVGTDVKIMLRRARKEEWMAMAQTFKMMDELGIITKPMMVDEFGFDDDYEHISEEWMEQKGMEMALSNPDFATFFTIPAQIAGEIKEAEGDPEKQQTLREMLAEWKQFISQPKQQEMAMQQQQAMQPPQPQGMNPPTAAGVSYPQLNQGPGSVSGQQGGQPQAPLGPQGIGA